MDRDITFAELLDTQNQQDPAFRARVLAQAQEELDALCCAYSNYSLLWPEFAPLRPVMDAAMQALLDWPEQEHADG